jgi:hypothetical protein
MKNLILALSIVLLLGGCDNSGMNEKENPLIGTWEDTWNDDDGDLHKERYTFSENDFDYAYNGFIHKDVNFHRSKEPHNIIQKGTYQLNDSAITFFCSETTIDGENVNPAASTTVNYTVSKNELTLTIRGTSYIFQKGLTGANH